MTSEKPGDDNTSLGIFFNLSIIAKAIDRLRYCYNAFRAGVGKLRQVLVFIIVSYVVSMSGVRHIPRHSKSINPAAPIQLRFTKIFVLSSHHHGH